MSYFGAISAFHSELDAAMRKKSGSLPKMLEGLSCRDKENPAGLDHKMIFAALELVCNKPDLPL